MFSIYQVYDYLYVVAPFILIHQEVAYEMANVQIDEIIIPINNDKELKDTIENVSVEDSKLGKKYPYYYAIKHVTKEQADEIKS